MQLNQDDDIQLLIDTGAALTTLTRTAFDQLNSQSQAQYTGSRFFQTANGTIKGEIYLFPQVNFGAYRLYDLPIAVLDFSMSEGIDGLLGMNTLGKFHFQLDQDQGVLLLNPRN